jgi:NADPH-dependent F420 reductase
MQIGIVGGTGEQGSGLALRWAMAGEGVILGSRSQARAERVAAALNAGLGGGTIRGMENREVAASADLVVLTVPYAAHLATLDAIKRDLEGKILVDVSVPLDPENPRRLKTPPPGSAVEEAQAFLGPATRVVGAFQNISAHVLSDPDHAADCDVLVCGDDGGAKGIVMSLVTRMGLYAFDVGPAESARAVEALTPILIRLNIRHKVKGSGIHLTGLPR